MTPVGANGESEPACAPLPTMMIIRNAGMAARPATAIAIGASSAAVETLPGPSEASAAAEHEEHHRNEPGVAAADVHGAVRDPVERAVQLRLREQQRHAGQREEQRDREAGDHLVERHAAEVDADDPGQRERQDADVQLREAADENRDDERGQRYVGEIHSVPLKSA